MKKKIYIVCAALLLVIIAVVGLQKNNEVKNNKSAKRNKADIITIGFSFDTFLVDRWKKDRDVFVSKIKDCDSSADVIVKNANGNVERQIDNIEYLIDKKVDVLVIVSIDSEKLKGVIKKAKKENIKIIAYDRLIRDPEVDLYITFDNKQVGKSMARALCNEGLPRKKVLMIAGPKEDNNVSTVEEGFKEVMKENGVEIVDKHYTENWNADDAADYIKNLYEDEEKRKMLESIDGIMCGNDNIATTVITKLSELKLVGKIKVVGQDADLDACQRIVEGIQVMTVYKEVEKLAETAAEYAYKFAKGIKVKITERYKDGDIDYPYVCLETIPVTKKNMEEVIISSGFHSRDEVYVNGYLDEETSENITE